MRAILFSFMLMATSCTCTYNISMAHSQGTASDMIDDNTSAAPTNTVSPNLTVPASVL